MKLQFDIFCLLAAPHFCMRVKQNIYSSFQKERRQKVHKVQYNQGQGRDEVKHGTNALENLLRAGVCRVTSFYATNCPQLSEAILAYVSGFSEVVGGGEGKAPSPSPQEGRILGSRPYIHTTVLSYKWLGQFQAWLCPWAFVIFNSDNCKCLAVGSARNLTM